MVITRIMRLIRQESTQKGLALMHASFRLSVKFTYYQRNISLALIGDNMVATIVTEIKYCDITDIEILVLKSCLNVMASLT